VIVLLVIAAFIFYIMENKPRQFDWSLTLYPESKEPYGGYIFDQSLPDLFPNARIEKTDSSIYTTLRGESEEQGLEQGQGQDTLYLILEDQYVMSLVDSRSMLDFVERGNSAFFALGDYVSEGLIFDSLRIVHEFLDFDRSFTKLDSTKDGKSFVQFEFIDSYLQEGPEHYFPSKYRLGSFESFGLEPDSVKKPYDVLAYYKTKYDPFFFNEIDDDEAADTIGTMVHAKTESNEICYPHYVRIKYGEGFFYFHNYLETFTNYHMSNDTSLAYIEKVFANLEPDVLIYDNYYKPWRQKAPADKSRLKVLLKSEPMRWLRTLSFVGILFLIFSLIKRKQRIIPVITPVRNETIDFIETLGMLYFNDRGHKSLANRKVSHFFEYLRRNYYLQEIETTKKGAKAISAKTGLSQEKIMRLFSVIRNMELRKEVYDTDLVNVNRIIDELYKDMGAGSFS